VVYVRYGFENIKDNTNKNGIIRLIFFNPSPSVVINKNTSQVNKQLAKFVQISCG